MLLVSKKQNNRSPILGPKGDSMQIKKIAIIGTGGVGGYFGGLIADAGHDVTFVARGEHLEAIRRNGLTVHGLARDFTVFPACAVDDIKKIPKPDLVILGVKAWQVKGVARELESVIHDQTMVLPLQNGILAVEEIAGELGEDHVIGGLCKIISKIKSPGVIRHLGVEPLIVLGETDNTLSPRVLQVKELFDNAGIHCRVTENILGELWGKFIAICVSALLAVTRSTYGEVRALEETRQLMHDLLTEIYTLSVKMGIPLEENIVEKTMTIIDTYPHDSTSSLTRDVWEGRPSEIEYQNGSVVNLGKKYNVETPVNRFIYRCILPMEHRAK
jgi:2-dehydropantoate 2-reductase